MSRQALPRFKSCRAHNSNGNATAPLLRGLPVFPAKAPKYSVIFYWQDKKTARGWPKAVARRV